MLLREPDGNSVQLYNNNPTQPSHEPSWIDKDLSDAQTFQLDANTNSLSVGYRDGQLALNTSLDNANNQIENFNCFVSDDTSGQLLLEAKRLNLDLDCASKLPIASDDFSPDEGLFDYEDENNSFSSSSSTPDDDKIFDQSASDESCSNERIVYHIPRGIHNPNYPGFQHLAYTLQDFAIDTPTSFENICELEKDYIERLRCSEIDFANNNCDCVKVDDIENSSEIVPHSEIDEQRLGDSDYVTSGNDISASIETVENVECPNERDLFDYSDDLIELKREIYESIQKPIAETLENITEVVNNVIRQIVEQHDVHGEIWKISAESERHLRKLIGLSLKKMQKEEKLNLEEGVEQMENNNDRKEDKSRRIVEMIKTSIDDAYMSSVAEDLLDNQSCIDLNKIDGEICPNQELDVNSNKMDKDNAEKKEIKGDCTKNKRPGKICTERDAEKKANSMELQGGEFDVYNIETAMPLIDLDAIESHLRAAREEERRRRNDREEIRRRLAMGTEHDEYYALGDRPGRKPSLQSRLQSGMNLQICFMNETASDTESPSDVEFNTSTSPKKVSVHSKYGGEKLKVGEKHKANTVLSNGKISKLGKGSGFTRPSSLPLKECNKTADVSAKLDFFECQAKLQTEARMALAQAKEIAHMQMEVERQRQDKSPITEMLRCSLRKAGLDLLGERRRVSRQMLTDINVAQLQVIVNELHTQIEKLNEVLVELLIARDELHMGQDSMLVDIEDLTRHLGAKDLSCTNPHLIQKSDKAHDEEKISKNQTRVSSIHLALKK